MADKKDKENHGLPFVEDSEGFLAHAEKLGGSMKDYWTGGEKTEGFKESAAHAANTALETGKAIGEVGKNIGKGFLDSGEQALDNLAKHGRLVDYNNAGKAVSQIGDLFRFDKTTNSTSVARTVFHLSGGMPITTCNASLQCSSGTLFTKMIVDPIKRVSIGGNPVANVLDFKPLYNIPGFGLCWNLMNPVVFAQTMTNLALTGKFVIIPTACSATMFPTPWVPPVPTVNVGKSPILKQGYTSSCWGLGSIQIVHCGQGADATPYNLANGLIGPDRNKGIMNVLNLAMNFLPMGQALAKTKNATTALKVLNYTDTALNALDLYMNIVQEEGVGTGMAAISTILSIKGIGDVRAINRTLQRGGTAEAIISNAHMTPQQKELYDQLKIAQNAKGAARDAEYAAQNSARDANLDAVEKQIRASDSAMDYANKQNALNNKQNQLSETQNQRKQLEDSIQNDKNRKEELEEEIESAKADAENKAKVKNEATREKTKAQNERTIDRDQKLWEATDERTQQAIDELIDADIDKAAKKEVAAQKEYDDAMDNLGAKQQELDKINNRITHNEDQLNEVKATEKQQIAEKNNLENEAKEAKQKSELDQQEANKARQKAQESSDTAKQKSKEADQAQKEADRAEKAVDKAKKEEEKAEKAVEKAKEKEAKQAEKDARRAEKAKGESSAVGDTLGIAANDYAYQFEVEKTKESSQKMLKKANEDPDGFMEEHKDELANRPKEQVEHEKQNENQNIEDKMNAFLDYI